MAQTFPKLKKAKEEGRLKKRFRDSRYAHLARELKDSKEPGMQVENLTTSQLTQLQNALPKVLGKGKATVRTISKKGTGEGVLYTVRVIKVGPQTKEVL